MMTGRHSAAMLALCLASVVALAGFAAASVGSQPAPAPASASGVHRSVVWYGVPQVAPRSFHIESTSVNTPVQDEFQITYVDGNFTLVYQRVAGGPITTQYTMSVAGLVEWNDTSGDGQFEESVPLVAYTALGPSAFAGTVVQHNVANLSDGVQVNTFEIQSKKGDVALNLTIADGFVSLPSGQNLTPMEAKLTLVVNHTMVRPDTRLSMQLAISTDQKVALENQSWDDQNDFSTDDHALNVTNDAGPNGSSAFFAWSTFASVNNARGPVVTSGPFTNESTGSYDLYLTYPQQAPGSLQLRIVHDPTMGVVSVAYLSSIHPPPPPPLGFQGDAVLYGISLGAIAVFVAGSVVLVRRRRRPPV